MGCLIFLCKINASRRWETCLTDIHVVSKELQQAELLDRRLSVVGIDYEENLSTVVGIDY